MAVPTSTSPGVVRAKDEAVLCAWNEAELRGQLESLSPLVMVKKSADYGPKRNHEPMMLGAWVKTFMSELRFPLEVEKSEKPDFLIHSDGKYIGLEVTRIDNPNLQRFRDMQDKGVIPRGSFRVPDRKMSKAEAKKHMDCREPVFRDPGPDPAPDTIAEEIIRVVGEKTDKLRDFSRGGAPCDLIIDHNANPDGSLFMGFRTEYPECKLHRDRLMARLRQELVPRIRKDKILRRVVIANVGGGSSTCFIADARDGFAPLSYFRQKGA